MPKAPCHPEIDLNLMPEREPWANEHYICPNCYGTYPTTAFKEQVMKPYIGTKFINAKPMTRAEYNIFRGWELPADENGDDNGLLIEYIDGGKANTEQFAGYVSWSPDEVFYRAYRPCDGMSFGLAVEAVKQGKKAARKGWNGKEMFIFLVPGSIFQVNRPPLLGIYPGGTEINYRSHIDMKTADGSIVPWVASQTDILADDWVIVE